MYPVFLGPEMIQKPSVKATNAFTLSLCCNVELRLLNPDVVNHRSQYYKLNDLYILYTKPLTLNSNSASVHVLD